MRTLTYQLRDLKKFMICIGFEDENNRTQVRIDCGEVFAEYPNAAVTMKVQAPKGGIYPATVTREDDVILWTVRDCDVANKGSGEFQLTFTDGTTVVKTCVGKFHVDRSLKGSGTAPSGVQDWLDHAEDVLEQVESAEIHQPMIGLDGYWYKWDQEAGEYVSTGTKAQGQDGQPGTDATPDLIAKDYADLSFPVAKDSFCYHDGKLYQAKHAIQTAEDWTAAHWQETTVEEKITDIKNTLDSSEDDVYRLANAANIDEPYERTGTATSGSTAWAETITVKGIKLRAGEKYTFSTSVSAALASNISSYLADSNGTTITSLQLVAGQTNTSKSYTADNNYNDAYIYFRTGITTGVTLTNTIWVDGTVPAIDVLKTGMEQNILAIPLKNATQSAVTNYRAYYYAVKSGTVLHIRTKSGSSLNVLATYSDNTTGILIAANGDDKSVTVSKDIKYLGYYLSAGFDDLLYIYGTVYLDQRAELEQIKNCAEVKKGSFSITGYVKSDGSFNSADSNAKRTDYIAVEQYDHLFVNTVIGAAGCSIAFYDGNKIFISDDSETGTKSNYTKAIPQTAKYVIFSEYSYPSASAYLYVDGSVAREQVLGKKDIADLQTWSRKIFDTDALGTFAKFGVCGDSLSVGYMDDSGGTAHGRNIYYSWGQVLARRYGNICLNFGFSGCTTKTWYTNATHGKIEVIAPENLCQCYLVGLGANDSVNDSNVGTASDINLSDYTQNADTFYGNYGKVLQLILDTAQHGYVFAFTLPTLSYATDLKNNAIRGVVEKINNDRLFLVDLEQDYKYLFTSSFIADNVVGAHYSALGYANIATAISIAVTDVMNKNNTDFTDLAFAPYGSNNVIE